MSKRARGAEVRRWPGRGLSVLVLAAAVALASCGSPSVGLVDSQRILNESVIALSYQKQLDDREKAMAADLRLLSGTLSKEDLDARRAGYQRELAALKQRMEEGLNTQIRKGVAEVARKRRLRVVLLRHAVTLGGIDVTTDVIEAMKR